jgi:branched-chain amino acid transport system permease protein
VDRLPASLVGIDNTVNLYRIAPACPVLTPAVVQWAVRSPTGRVWQGIKENERPSAESAERKETPTP